MSDWKEYHLRPEGTPSQIGRNTISDRQEGKPSQTGRNTISDWKEYHLRPERMSYQTPCVIQDGYTLRCAQLAVDTTGNAMWTAWILTHRDEYKSGQLINRVIPSFQNP